MISIVLMFYGLVALGVLTSADDGKPAHPVVAMIVALMWPILVGVLIGRQFKAERGASQKERA